MQEQTGLPEWTQTIRQGLKEDGYTVSISQLYRWFDVPRRTVYYRRTRKPPAIQERYWVPIKRMIENIRLSAIAQSRICWDSTRTPCSGFSS